MKITVNGKITDLNGAPDVAHDIATLLRAQGCKDMLVAVAVNGAFVARERYAQTALRDGDAVEIVAPMQGG